MPRTVQFEGQTHQFPDDATDDEIQQALSGGSSAKSQPNGESTLDAAYRYSGLKGVVEGVKGAAKELAATSSGINALGRKIPGVAKVSDAVFGPPASPEQMQEIAKPSNPAQAVGKAAMNVAEFAAPGGAVERGAAMLSRAPNAARILAKAVLEGASAGTVAGLQSGGDPKTMGTAAAAAGATSGVMGAAKAMLPSKTALAKRLYQSALKPPPSMDAAERQAIIDTGLKEGITLDPDVVANVQGRISAINEKIAKEIEERSAAGATVDPEAVAKYTDRSKARFQTVNPEADTSAIEASKQEFLRNQPQAPYTKIRPTLDPDEATVRPFTPEGQGSTPLPIPLKSAQAQKVKTYAKLKDSYGEQSTAIREAQKDLARGLKDGIVQAFPEIAQLNARESALLALESSLERFAGREGNKQLIGLGMPMTATALHSAGAPVIPLTLLKTALEQPEIKSRLAIALAKSAANPGPGSALMRGVGRMAPPGAAAVMPPPGTQQ